ncbi:MAG: HlyD family efflux transporter periplasmic adaptor subunit [Microcoleus sp. SM1_3_4]|nr:HlyD family efflux transporter periplasmic adaptor subunit [Microcoleus sp. SM1_3_4]
MAVGGLFQIAAVGIAFTLAAVIKYNVTVRAPANVRPAGEVRIVQAAISGTVESIKVKENQFVKQGSAIAILDDSALQTQKSKLQLNIGQLKLQLAQIAAQIRALDTQKLAEIDRANRAVTAAEAELIRRQRDYQDKQQNSTAEVDEAEANLRLAQKELQKARADFKSSEANLRSNQAALTAAISKWNRYQPLEETGALAQDQLDEAQLAVKQQEQAVAAQKAAIEAQKQTIERQQQAIEAAKARLQRSKTALNPSSAEIAIALESIAREKAAGASTIAILNREKEALIQQKIEIGKQLDRDVKELQQIETEIAKTVIRATADGTILKLELRNSGQVVNATEAIAQIAPKKAPAVIIARVAARDIGKVQICQQKSVAGCQQGKVKLRISAYPYPDYGTLKAAIRSIAPDATTAISQPANISSETAHYQVTIEPENTYLVKDNIQYPLQPGMEVTADIISKEETVLTFILRKARLIADL